MPSVAGLGFSHDSCLGRSLDDVSYHVRLDHYADRHSPDPVGGCGNRRPRLRIRCGFNQGLRRAEGCGNLDAQLQIRCEFTYPAPLGHSRWIGPRLGARPMPYPEAWPYPSEWPVGSPSVV